MNHVILVALIIRAEDVADWITVIHDIDITVEVLLPSLMTTRTVEVPLPRLITKKKHSAGSLTDVDDIEHSRGSFN